MGAVMNKIQDLEYNELITLGVIERNADLTDIFRDAIKMPFPILIRLQKENQLNDETKNLLLDIFNKIIVTKREFVDIYQRLASGEAMVKAEPAPVVEAVEPIVAEVQPVKVTKKKVTEKTLPRRYGRLKVLKDIEQQGGVATPAQRASLESNDVKNIYVAMDARLIEQMLTGSGLDDNDCRQFTAAVTTFKRLVMPIINKSKKRNKKKKE